jgi:hypothetical protein
MANTKKKPSNPPSTPISWFQLPSPSLIPISSSKVFYCYKGMCQTHWNVSSTYNFLIIPSIFWHRPFEMPFQAFIPLSSPHLTDVYITATSKNVITMRLVNIPQLKVQTPCGKELDFFGAPFAQFFSLCGSVNQPPFPCFLPPLLPFQCQHMHSIYPYDPNNIIYGSAS